jgi:hypothetical protein
VDIVFKAPTYLLLLFGGVVLVAVVSALLKKWEPWKKIVTVVVAVVVCGVLLFVFYRDKHLVVDDQGIHADVYGNMSIPWSAVQKAVEINGLAASPHAVKIRTNGVSAGNYRVGWFKLADGSTAFVTLEVADRALLIESNGTTYLFGPQQMDAFVSEVGKHVTVQK